MATFDLKDLERRMKGAIEDLRRELGGLRAGRAAVSLLEPIVVEAYGSKMPLNQVANINVPEPRMLTVQVWDKAVVTAVERAIRASNLGVNPSVEGQIVRVHIPELTEERRRELTKVAARYAEEHRVAVRNVRRDGMESLRSMEKDGDVSKDEHHRHADEVQKLTDSMIAKIDETLAVKEQEIMQV